MCFTVRRRRPEDHTASGRHITGVPCTPTLAEGGVGNIGNNRIKFMPPI